MTSIDGDDERSLEVSFRGDIILKNMEINKKNQSFFLLFIFSLFEKLKTKTRKMEDEEDES